MRCQLTWFDASPLQVIIIVVRWSDTEFINTGRWTFFTNLDKILVVLQSGNQVPSFHPRRRRRILPRMEWMMSQRQIRWCLLAEFSSDGSLDGLPMTVRFLLSPCFFCFRDNGTDDKHRLPVYVYVSLSASLALFDFVTVCSCVFVCLSVSECVCVCVPLSVFFSFSVFLPFSFWVCLLVLVSIFQSLSFCVWFSLSLCISVCVYVSVFLSLHLCVFLSLPDSVFLSVFFSLSRSLLLSYSLPTLLNLFSHFQDFLLNVWTVSTDMPAAWFPSNCRHHYGYKIS